MKPTTDKTPDPINSNLQHETDAGDKAVKHTLFTLAFYLSAMLLSYYRQLTPEQRKSLGEYWLGVEKMVEDTFSDEPENEGGR